MKTVFGKQGAFSWRDSVSLCIHHPKHAPFFVEKLWSYFIPEPPDAQTRAGLEEIYRKDFEVRPCSRRSSATRRSTRARAW